jgi:hypothetical protein
MKYEIRFKYPHLKENEEAIWTRFIDAFPDAYDAVDYDVLVGTGVEPKPEDSEAMKKDKEYLSKKKIDVVGYKAENIYIIEIRPRAGLDMIGKLIAYVELYRSIAPTGKTIKAVLITDEEMPDIRTLAERMGILLHIV